MIRSLIWAVSAFIFLSFAGCGLGNSVCRSPP